MTERFFIDENGMFLGAFVGAEPPIGSHEVPTAPATVAMRWINGAWSHPQPELTDLRAQKMSAIAATADALLAEGVPLDDGLHVALDDGARADLTAMATTASLAASELLPWPESYARGWISMENVRIPLPSPEDGLLLAAKAGNYYAAIVQHRRDLKDAVLAAEDVAALNAIDIAAGWPAP